MHKTPIVALLLAAAGVFSTSALAAVEVSFNDSKHYTDVGTANRQLVEATRDIQKTFEKLGQKYLAPNQDLKVEILDIDLAGQDRFLRPPLDEVRVLRGAADWPTIKLRYRLEADGRTLASGEDSISDMAYQMDNLPNSSNEQFYYENQMLEKWFVKTFGKNAETVKR